MIGYKDNKSGQNKNKPHVGFLPTFSESCDLENVGHVNECARCWLDLP